jgi:thymidylate synthase (FAD)
MRLIKPYFEIIKEDNPYKKIENCGRVCYQSECLITDDSYIKFISKIKERNHYSVLEHHNLIFAITNSAFYKWFITFNDGMSTKYLKLSRDKAHSYHRCFVSGNVRAFRNLIIDVFNYIKQVNDIEDNFMFLELYYYLINKYSLFFKDLINKEPFPVIKHTYEKDNQTLFFELNNTELLTFDEKLIHECVSVNFVCDRGVTHELVRHRNNIAFSQESTRYCNYSKDKFGNQLTYIIPPWVNISEHEYHEGEKRNFEFSSDIDKEFFFDCAINESRYLNAINYGLQPQQARGKLSHHIKTEIVVTTNLKEWQWIFYMRTSNAAHPQMRELMIPLHEEFQKMYPNWVDYVNS